MSAKDEWTAFESCSILEWIDYPKHEEANHFISQQKIYQTIRDFYHVFVDSSCAVSEIFDIFRAERWRFGQKYLRENILKLSQGQAWRLLSLIDVCLVKTEFRSNDHEGSSYSVLEKPFIVPMYIMEIHETDIISINKKMTKESKQTKTKTFCGGSGKSRLEWRHS